MTVVDRAAEVLAATVDNDRQGLQEWWEFAQALADAGLLVADIEAHTTPELSAAADIRLLTELISDPSPTPFTDRVRRWIDEATTLSAEARAGTSVAEDDIEAHTTPELSALPCPSCGQRQIATLMLRSADGRHQHTRYICTHWEPQIGADGQLVPGNGWCGWEGWTVPGWDTIAAEHRAGSSVGEQRTHNASDAGSIPAPPTCRHERYALTRYGPNSASTVDCEDCGAIGYPQSSGVIHWP